LTSLATLIVIFPVIFLAELPDKSMFASLLLSTRGRPLGVWIGASLAFTVHVAIAVTVGTTLFTIAPHRVVEAVVALMFGTGAVLAFRDSFASEAADEAASEVGSLRRTVVTAFVVVFLAEWGDITQILMATLAAKYDALAVAAVSALALWSVAALAVAAGHLFERLPMPLVRRVTGAVLVALALMTGIEAVFGWVGPF